MQKIEHLGMEKFEHDGQMFYIYTATKKCYRADEEISIAQYMAALRAASSPKAEE